MEGRWCYLYRAIDKAGNIVDVMLSDVRDQAAAERFLDCSELSFYKAYKATRPPFCSFPDYSFQSIAY